MATPPYSSESDGSFCPRLSEDDRKWFEQHHKECIDQPVRTIIALQTELLRRPPACGPTTSCGAGGPAHPGGGAPPASSQVPKSLELDLWSFETNDALLELEAFVASVEGAARSWVGCGQGGRLMLGSKGCGKSARLKLFAKARAIACPGSFNCVVDVKSCTTAVNDLFSIVRQRWEIFRPKRDAPYTPHVSWESLLGEIFDTTSYPAFLAIDEFHVLFFHPPPEKTSKPPLLADASNLASIGRIGKVAVVLCGSASSTRALSFCHLEPSPLYPGYSKGHSLNHTKYSALEVSPPSPTTCKFILASVLLTAKLSEFPPSFTAQSDGCIDVEWPGKHKEAMQAMFEAAFVASCGDSRVLINAGDAVVCVLNSDSPDLDPGILWGTAEDSEIRGAPLGHSAWAVETRYQKLIHPSLLTAILQPRRADGSDGSPADGEPFEENLDLYISRLLEGDEPMWVPWTRENFPKVSEMHTSDEKFLGQAYSYADAGFLQLRDTSRSPGDPAMVTFLHPIQAILALSSKKSRAGPLPPGLSSYNRICLRYPYGTLGIDAEQIVARCLAEFSSSPGNGPTLAASGKSVWFPRKGSKGSPPPSPELASSSLKKRRQAFSQLTKLDPGCLSIASADGCNPATWTQRREFLKEHQHQVFKEMPDKYGGDLLWWSWKEVEGTSGPGKRYAVSITRVQVKLGCSTLDVKTTASKLADGWSAMKPYFQCGENVELKPNLVILTTRRLGEFTDSASEGESIPTVEAKGFHVQVWGREYLIANGIWNDDIQRWGRHFGLSSYYEEGKEEDDEEEVEEDDEERKDD